MAIQNDNTLVTKGDLKSLYTDKIAPYLGGGISYYHTDRTGEELKVGEYSLSGNLPDSTSQNTKFNILSYSIYGGDTKRADFLLDNNTVIIPEGVTVKLSAELYLMPGDASKEVNIEIRFKDYLNNVDLDYVTTTYFGAGYSRSGTWSTIFTAPTGGAKIGLRCTYCNGTRTINSSSRLIVEEIGRIVDPVKYVDNNSDLQETPVGNIISYMGNSVPKHYLACDGTTYSIGTYPELEAFIIDEFGSINYFGGDGSATWAVPDLKGEFLRGAGTNGHTGQGAGGNVGEHQDGTVHNIAQVSDAIYVSNTQSATRDYIIKSRDTNGQWVYGNAHTISNLGDSYRDYTSRPTNTSVQYCIKYESTFHAFFSNAAYKVEGIFNLTYNSTPKRYDVSSITYTVGDSTLIDGAYFVAPMDGWYAVSFKSSQVTYASPAVQYLGIISSRGNYSLTNGTGSGTGHSHFGIEASDVLYLTKGDKVTYQVWTNGNTIPTPDTRKATFCLLESNYNPTIVSADSIYSENEQMIGYWKDGKPLYQKTISTTLGSSTTLAKSISVGVSIDTVIDIFGGVLSENTWNPINCVNNGTQYVVKAYVRNNSYPTSSEKNTIQLYNSLEIFINKPVNITIQYTKTTDTASSLQIENSLLLNRPDLWEVGTEYHFGGGLYGIRKTGTFSRSTDERIDITIVSSLTTTARPINTGGWIKFPDGWEISIPGNWTQGVAATDIQFVSPAWHQNDKIFISTVTPHTGTYIYDFWVTYKK